MLAAEAVAQIRRTGFCLWRAANRPVSGLMKSVASVLASRSQRLL
jgi:hypothetical protein